MIKGVAPFLVSTMYRPPNATIKYYNAMLDAIEKATGEDKHIYLFGDFNFDYVVNESLYNNPIYHIETLFNLKQLLDFPTRVTLLRLLILCSPPIPTYIL